MGGTIYTSIGTGLRIVSGIIATKILATYLPRSDLGSIVLIELVAEFLAMIGVFSIGVAAIRSLAHAEPKEQESIVNSAVIFCLITFVLVALLFLMAQRLVYRLLGEQPIDNVSIVIVAYTLVLIYRRVLREMVQGFFQFKQMALIELGASILNVALLIVFLLGMKTGLVGAVLARIVAAGVASVLFYISLPTKKGLFFRLGTLTQMLRFSWPLQMNELLTFAFSKFGTVVVATVMTPADVALLNLSGTIPGKVRQLYESFRTVYFPNFTSLIVRKDRRRADKLLNTTLRGVTFLTALATVLVFVFQRELILLFFSDQYLDIGPILVLSMFSLSFALIGNVLGYSAVAAGNSRAPAATNVVNMTFTVVGNLTLVPLFGVIGAVLAGLIGRTAAIPVNVWFVRGSDLSPKVVGCVKLLLFLGVLGGVAWWLQPESWIARLPFLLAFVVGSFLLSIVGLADIRALWDGILQPCVQRLRKWPV
jgi:O-antigen/teichoic acid export membrane protein